jgi:hypothetical protein
MSFMIGRMHHVVIDCADPSALAAFYADPAGHPFCLISALGTADRLGQGGGPVNRGDRRGDVLVIGGPVTDRDPQNLAIMPP